MNEVNEAIDGYLKKLGTNFALLISGEWGAGKTYYIQHTLKSYIQNEQGDRKKYSVIYISLNGVSNVEEISEQMIINRLKINNKINYGYGLVKSAIKVLGSIPGLNNIWLGDVLSTSIDEVGKVANSFLDFDNYVIILDDLERIDESLKIEKIFGFINTNLLEKGIKTILVANETELNKKYNYSEYKEKFIDRTIFFKQNLSEMILPFIETFLDDENFSDVLSYIRKDQIEILRLIEASGCTNLRTIRFSFENFSYIFNELLHRNPTDDHIRMIFMFTLTISIQYKLGLSKLSELEEDLRSCHNGERMAREINESISHQFEFTYSQEFYKKYLLNKNVPWTYYSSIYYFVSFGVLDKKRLNEEFTLLNMYASDKSESDLEMEKLIRYEELEYDELKSTIEKVLSYAIKGRYLTWSYLTICEKIITLSENNIIDISFDDLYKQLERGMLISINRELNDGDSFFLNRYSQSFGPYLKNEVYVKLYDLHKFHLNKFRNDKARQLFDSKILKSIKSLDIDLLKKTEKYVLNEPKVFLGMEPEEFSQCILNFSNKQLRALYKLVETRFMHKEVDGENTKYKAEISNLFFLLKNILTVKVKCAEIDSLKRYNLMSFLELLDVCYKKLDT